MDKFVTVTKPSSSRATNSDGKKTKTNHKYSPYGTSKSNEREVEIWKDNNRTQRILAPFRKDSASSSSRVSSERVTKHLLNTLTDESNPITHSDSVRRADHVSSVATGHQRGEKHGSRRTYLDTRNAKLAEQTTTQETCVLRNVRVYINGYIQDTTDIEMKRIVSQAGGEVMRTVSGATHIVTSQQLNGSKTHKLLTSKAKHKVHVVRPEWVMDSINGGMRLPERAYSILSDTTTSNLGDMMEGGSYNQKRKIHRSYKDVRNVPLA